MITITIRGCTVHTETQSAVSGALWSRISGWNLLDLSRRSCRPRCRRRRCCEFWSTQMCWKCLELVKLHQQLHFRAWQNPARLNSGLDSLSSSQSMGWNWESGITDRNVSSTLGVDVHHFKGLKFPVASLVRGKQLERVATVRTAIVQLFPSRTQCAKQSLYS